MIKLTDWMLDAIDRSFTCQFTSFTGRDVPVAVPVFVNHFDPEIGTLIFSSALRTRRIANIRRNPGVAILFSPAGTGGDEPRLVLLVQGLAEVDDSDTEHGWEPYFEGWARRQPSARALLQRRAEMPDYWRRALIRVRPARLLGWRDGDLNQPPEALEASQ